MIEKLDSKMDCVEITVLGKHIECLGFDSAKEIGKKLNDLVDAVNELQNMQVQVNDHELKIASIYDQLNGFRAVMRENGWNIDGTYPEHIADASKMIDPYAEQRRWIGKLCRFWNDDESLEYSMYGELVNIFDAPHEDCPFQCGYGEWYEHCEPVSPDDDIIYRGE